MEKNGTFVVLAFALCTLGCPPPPCMPPTPPTWMTPTWADGCAPAPSVLPDFSNWNGTEQDIQKYGVEWPVYDAKLAFSLFPQAFQQQHEKDYQTANTAAQQADTAFINAVNLVIAAKAPDYNAAMADAEAAAEAIFALVDGLVPAATIAATTDTERANIVNAHQALADGHKKMIQAPSH